MTYRISSFLLACAFLLTGFAVPAQAATSQVYHVTLKAGEKPPTCKARSTKKRIYAGQVTTLVWESKHADKMIGITKGGEWDADGRQKVAIGFAGKKEFPMTFIGEGGIATCVATVFVKPKKEKK